MMFPGTAIAELAFHRHLKGTPMTDPLQDAITLATWAATVDGGPFGAVIILPDGTRIEATNSVTRDHDPTAHAEVNAIRLAAHHTGDNDLTGAVLYSSCQPCPMCLTAALWARIDRLIYAAADHEAAAAGFDDASFYAQLRGTVTDLALERQEHPARLDPFTAWADNTHATTY